MQKMQESGDKKGRIVKIEQEPKFQPITIILETKREAEMLWQSVRDYPARGPVEIEFYKRMSDWFCEKAQM